MGANLRSKGQVKVTGNNNLKNHFHHIVVHIFMKSGSYYVRQRWKRSSGYSTHIVENTSL